MIAVLNRYFGEMSDAVLDNGGTLVAFLGDGLIAVFGAPIECDDHADRAVAAAREMLGDRLPRFNDWAREQGYGDPFRMGIGISSGPLMSGNVGSERRLEYTAIGDTVNTASRIESLTKELGHPRAPVGVDARPPDDPERRPRVRRRGHGARTKRADAGLGPSRARGQPVRRPGARRGTRASKRINDAGSRPRG